MRKNPFADKASIEELGKVLSIGTQKSLDALQSEARVVGDTRLKLETPTETCQTIPKTKQKKKLSPKRK